MELNEDLSSDSISVKKCLASSSTVTGELKSDADSVTNGLQNKSPKCGDKEEGDVDNEDGKEDSEKGKKSENSKKESQNPNVIEDKVDFNKCKNTMVVQNGVTEESTVQIEDRDDSSVKENDEVINLSITKKSDKDESTTENDEKSEAMDLSKEVNGTGGTPSKKKPQKLLVDITPRRSSRNLNKQKSYAEKDLLNAQIEKSKTTEINEEIEDVIPKDPLLDDPKLKNRSKPIVINDTKGLIEFASNTKPTKSHMKKEPTLVIIDTNSILSGKGPIPISHAQTTALIGQNTEISLQHHPVRLVNNNSFKTGAPSTLRTPPQIKPIIVAPISGTSVSITGTTVSTNLTSSATPKAPAILPSLTDDMFVVEAPSFIVPYVYEKPPKESLKLFIERLQTNIKEIEEKERIEKESQLKKELVKSEAEEEVKNEETETIHENGNEDIKLEVKDEEHYDEKMEVNKEDESLNLKIVKSELTIDPDNKEVVATIDSENKEVAVTEDLKKSVVSAEDLTAKVETKDLEDATEKIIKKPSISYFDNPLGKFFMHIGLNLVQEHVQTDLLRTQKRKRVKEGTKCADDVNSAINTLAKTLEFSKETNDPFKLEFKKCDLCSFKTESILVMNHHLETPHMKNYIYTCNFCQLEFRSPSGIMFHMEAEHCIRGRLERAPAFNQCPNCPFEDNQKGKLTRHLVSCCKKYRPERNQEPPLDWEPPAKIPRVTRNRPPLMNPTNSVYQSAMSGVKQIQTNTLLPKLMHLPRSVGQPTMMNKNRPIVKSTSSSFVNNKFPITVSQRSTGEGMLYKVAGNANQPPGLLPATFPITAAQLYQQQAAKQAHQQQQGLAAAKLLQQSSISITPLPRQNTSSTSTAGSSSSNLLAYAKPGKPPNNSNNNKTNSSFVICEICDGYIKDLEQLRNHMQWIHKVKIHPKMIYNRPPLNCQKCQFRFFTDQGLERHLLGSHGLVTSSMQEAANKGKDGGRCPVCGRVYQWKLLNHVARDHNMPLKPAHLSYKCTVCTATFGMYKQFENHVYSAHSVVAKRSIENKKPTSQSSLSSQNALLKPLKINNEITIIPQPVVRISKQLNNKSR